MLSVIIPAYNEVDTIAHTLDEVLAVPLVHEVVVVDDGSTDGTDRVLASIDDARIRVVRHPQRQGKGTAIRTAIPLVQGEVVVIQDADMEYSPDQLPLLLERILSGDAEVVYGSRFRGEITGMKMANRIGNRALTAIANVLYSARISDEATCYKMFRTSLLKSIPLRCTQFEFCPEVTARVRRRGVPIAEVPIRYHGRAHSAGKKIRWWDFVAAVWTLVRHRFGPP